MSCPFCGVIPKIYEAPNHANCIVYWIKCVEYKCTGNASTYQTGTPNQAIKLWNTRRKKV